MTITKNNFERFFEDKPWESMVCFAEIGEEISEINKTFEIDSVEDDNGSPPETEGVYFEAGGQFHIVFSIVVNYAIGKDHKHYAVVPITAARAGEIISSFIASKDKKINAMKKHINKIKSFVDFSE